MPALLAPVQFFGCPFLCLPPFPFTTSPADNFVARGRETFATPVGLRFLFFTTLPPPSLDELPARPIESFHRRRSSAAPSCLSSILYLSRGRSPPIGHRVPLLCPVFCPPLPAKNPVERSLSRRYAIKWRDDDGGTRRKHKNHSSRMVKVVLWCCERKKEKVIVLSVSEVVKLKTCCLFCIVSICETASISLKGWRKIASLPLSPFLPPS